MTPFQSGVKVGDDKASFKSSSLPGLFKTFNLIPLGVTVKMTAFIMSVKS